MEVIYLARGFDAKTTAGVHWSKTERDWMLTAPTSATRAMLCNDLIRTDTFKHLLKELEDRGYDITTLRLSVKKKQTN